MSEYTERAIENLTNYQAPLDPDGIKVAVSREALEIALDEIQSLRQKLKQLEADKAELMESLRPLESWMEHCPGAGHRVRIRALLQKHKEG